MDTTINWNDRRTVFACVDALRRENCKSCDIEVFSRRETLRQGKQWVEEWVFLRARVIFERVVNEQKFKDGEGVALHRSYTWNIHFARSAHLPFLFHVTLRACLPLSLVITRPLSRCRYLDPLLTPFVSLDRTAHVRPSHVRHAFA